MMAVADENVFHSSHRLSVIHVVLFRCALLCSAVITVDIPAAQMYLKINLVSEYTYASVYTLNVMFPPMPVWTVCCSHAAAGN